MKRSVLQGEPARFVALVDVLEVLGLVTLVVGVVLALAVAIVPAAEPPAAPLAKTTTAPAAEPAAPKAKTPAAEPAAPAPAPAGKASPIDSFVVADDSNLVLVLETGSRLYPDWKEERRVRLHERFVIGDTDNSAVATRFVPDFLIVDGRVKSVSAKPANPAVRIYVYRGEAAVDSSWAFLNFPPHFSPRSFFTFKLKEVLGYAGGSIRSAPDSSAAPVGRAEGHRAGDE